MNFKKIYLVQGVIYINNIYINYIIFNWIKSVILKFKNWPFNPYSHQ